ILNLRIKKAMKAGARIFVVNEGETELDRLAASKITIPRNGAGLAVKVLLAKALESEKAADQHNELRARATKQAAEVRRSVSAETVVQLEKLAGEIASAKGAVILYDEMATLAPNCADLAADLQALAVATDNIERPGSGVGPLFEDSNSLGAR